MKDRSLKNFVKLSHIKGIGFRFLKEFYERYSSFDGNIDANLEEFLNEKFNREKVEEVLSLWRSKVWFDRIWRFLKTHRVEVIPFFDSRFPNEVLSLGITTPALYVMGQLSVDGFSIVGTRRASAEGRLKARKFAEVVAAKGLAVISGGAEGIDRSAHEGALAVGGKTGVILGEGLYHFIRRNKDFAERVLKNGGFILSQFNLLTQGARWTFPQRNGLIAYFGFYGTLVVEAPQKSGALITADYALKLKRPLFTYLNCVQSVSFRGNLSLVKDCKARLITEEEELLKLLEERVSTVPLSGEEGVSAPREEKPGKDTLEEVLKEKPRTFDELLGLTKLSEDKLLERLTFLELEGKVVQDGGFYRWVG